MKQKITIEYDMLNRSIAIDCGDLSAFESLGLLEATKAMVAQTWLERSAQDGESDSNE